MKLVIDLGNTLQKLAVFSDGEMVCVETHKKISLKLLSGIFKRFSIDAAIISSVIHHDEEIGSFITSRCFCLVLDHNTPLPLVNKYESPETLGKDRLAAAVAGNHQFPGENVLVIDAGTCIKYDFVNSKSEYLGGAISPGLRIKLNALHTFTEKLPLIELNHYNELVGKTTPESLLSGVINGTLAEIDGVIDRYTETYSHIQVVLSGGDAEYLVGNLKNKTFVAPYIVLNGLKIILDYNDNQKTH